MKRKSVFGVIAALLVVSACVVVFLAHRRGAEIALEREQQRAAADSAAVYAVFRSARSTVQMRDGGRQSLVGNTATILWVKPQAGAVGAWVAVGRSAEGTFFGQRFKRAGDGAVSLEGDAQELSAERVMGGLRAQLREAGADTAQAQLLFDAAIKGTPVLVQGAGGPHN